MTTQEAYDRMVEYFSRPDAQLAKRTGKLAACYYRYPGDGRACAVGCLLPDGPGVDDALSGTVTDLRQRHPDIYEPLIGVDHSFLVAAQNAHDIGDTLSVATFLAKLHGIAADHSLKVHA